MQDEKSLARKAMVRPDSMQMLIDLEAGARGVVRQLRGGNEFANRIATLGFTIGAEISVIQNYGRGPVIVAVRDTRVALGRGEAAKVLVEVVRA
ncbi:MAG TPA: FeoA family protein [Anaerolineales bacterium]|nr:FeoA family protein [Anaerolineales bacterium]